MRCLGRKGVPSLLCQAACSVMPVSRGKGLSRCCHPLCRQSFLAPPLSQPPSKRPHPGRDAVGRAGASHPCGPRTRQSPPTFLPVLLRDWRASLTPPEPRGAFPPMRRQWTNADWVIAERWVQFQMLGPQVRGTALSLVSQREGSAVRKWPSRVTHYTTHPTLHSLHLSTWHIHLPSGSDQNLGTSFKPVS